MRNNDIVQKLWNLCDVLRDDGINYSDYVTELVLLLFIKMVHENEEAGILAAHTLPEQCRDHAGERIALDGEVLDGRSSVNQAPITGESLPVEKQAGDPLFAACRNQLDRQMRAFILACDRIVRADQQHQRIDTEGGDFQIVRTN